MIYFESSHLCFCLFLMFQILVFLLHLESQSQFQILFLSIPRILTYFQ